MKITLVIVSVCCFGCLHSQNRLPAFQKLIVGNWQCVKAPTSMMLFVNAHFMYDIYEYRTDSLEYKVSFDPGTKHYILKQFDKAYGEDDAVISWIQKLTTREMVLVQNGSNVPVTYRRYGTMTRRTVRGKGKE